MAYHAHHQQQQQESPYAPRPPQGVADQAAYAAGYQVGYEAGFRAGFAGGQGKGQGLQQGQGQWQGEQQGQQFIQALATGPYHQQQQNAPQAGVAAVKPQLPYRHTPQPPPPSAPPPHPSSRDPQQQQQLQLQHWLQPAPPIPPRLQHHPAPPAPSALSTPAHTSSHTSHPLQIWQPAPLTTFNYVLSSPPPTTHPVFPLSRFDVWIVDLFDTPADTVQKIHEAGGKAVAYFSAGSWEDWRVDKDTFFEAGREGGGGGSEDKGGKEEDDDDRGTKGKVKGKDKGNRKGIESGILGKPLDGWKGERWLDVRSERARDVMRRRLDLAREKGFDGVDPDNVDGYDNKNGLGLKRADAVEYVRWLAGEARMRGLACGLKNGSGFVKEVVDVVAFVVVEEAVRYKETEEYQCVARAGKPVWGVEYPKGEDEEDERQNDERRVEGRKRDEALKMGGSGWTCVIKNVRLDLWVQVD